MTTDSPATLFRRVAGALSFVVQPVLRAALIACCVAVAAPLAVLADGSLAETYPEMRIFTNKQGQQIEASVLRIDGSMRVVTIARPDGQEFEIAATSLSLDDQQYLREWLEQQPAPRAEEVNLRLQVDAVTSDPVRERFDDRIYSATGSRSKLAFEVGLLNLTRTPLVGLHLEYVVLLHDRVQIQEEDPDEPEQVRWRLRNNGPVVYRTGSLPLPPLRYNATEELRTGTIDLEKVRSTSLREDAEDAAIGVLLRVVTREGTVLLEQASIDRDYPQVDWQAFADNRDPRDSESGFGRLVENFVVN